MITTISTVNVGVSQSVNYLDVGLKLELEPNIYLDDDVAMKGSNNPSPVGSNLPAIDGNRDVRSDRKYGMVIAHNHIYWGHGISIGSETNAGVTNMEVYDNSFMHSEEGLRIKSDYARGGEVSNINYKNIRFN